MRLRAFVPLMLGMLASTVGSLWLAVTFALRSGLTGWGLVATAGMSAVVALGPARAAGRAFDRAFDRRWPDDDA